MMKEIKIQKRKLPRFSNVLKHTYMVLTLMLLLFPLYLTLVGSVKNLDQILEQFFYPTLPVYFENYARAFSYVSPYFMNTAYYAIASSVVTVMAASLAGYAFSALRFPFRRIFFLLLFAKMFLPGIMSLVPSYVLASKLGILNSSWVIILFCLGTSQPFWVFVMKTFVDQQPKELFEAMRIDGAKEIRIFSSLALPLLKPMVALMSLNVVLFIWNDFIWPLVTLLDPTKRTITIAIFKLSKTAGQDYGMLIAAYSLAALPLLIAFFFSMRSFMSGLTAGAIKL